MIGLPLIFVVCGKGSQKKKKGKKPLNSSIYWFQGEILSFLHSSGICCHCLPVWNYLGWKAGKKKYIFCPWVSVLVYVISSRRSQVRNNPDGFSGEHGKGIHVPGRTCAILGRAEVFLLGNFHPGEGVTEKSCDCPCHDALLTQWWITEATYEPLEQLPERKLGKLPPEHDTKLWSYLKHGKYQGQPMKQQLFETGLL